MRTFWIGLLLTLTLSAGANIRYDRTTVIEVTGALMDTRDVPEPPDVRGIHFFVRADETTVDVFVAPRLFYQSLGINLRPGTALTVTGSRVRCGTGDVVLARQIRWNGVNYLTLRDADGRPVWETPRMTD